MFFINFESFSVCFIWLSLPEMRCRMRGQGRERGRSGEKEETIEIHEKWRRTLSESTASREIFYTDGKPSAYNNIRS